MPSLELLKQPSPLREGGWPGLESTHFGGTFLKVLCGMFNVCSRGQLLGGITRALSLSIMFLSPSPRVWHESARNKNPAQYTEIREFHRIECVELLTEKLGRSRGWDGMYVGVWEPTIVYLGPF